MALVLITGATDGIGFETARQLLMAEHTVLLHGRHQARAEASREALAKSSSAARILPVWGDLSYMPEVVALAQQVNALAPTLDVLINNAGIYAPTRELTAEGFERTMAVNHFAHFLLTRLLIANLERAEQARVVTVSSGTHHSGRLALEDLTGNVGWTPYGAYANFKLANLLFTRALAKRLVRTHITANALHPGVIGTKLLQVGFSSGGAPASQGARTSVFLATAPEVRGVSGKYFVDCRETPAARNALDERVAEKLWAESERLLKAFLA
jgi:retinol dehydrogenase 14